MNRKTSLLLGYARRMEEVATLATQMQVIEARYRRENPGCDWDADLKEAMAGDRLARLARELRAGSPEQPGTADDNVLEPVGDPHPPAPGSALGLVPAPEWVQDGLGDQLTVAEQIALDAPTRADLQPMIDRED